VRGDKVGPLPGEDRLHERSMSGGVGESGREEVGFSIEGRREVLQLGDECYGVVDAIVQVCVDLI
jgi:hypothetical protein